MRYKQSLNKVQDTKMYESFRRIVYSDLANIAPENYIKKITARITDIKAVETPADRSAFIAILETAYRFTLGSVAGGKFQC